MTTPFDPNEDMSFSEWMRRGNSDLWRQMVEHRFCRDIGGDALPDRAFIRYLRYEHAFVRTAIRIFAFALAKAPIPADQDQLIEILNGLATEQDAYFGAAFASFGLDSAVLPADALPPKARGLRDGLLGFAAEESFAEILASMLAAEWAYLTWCTAARARGPKKPVCADWIRLHVEPPFQQQVAWLRQRLDEIGPTADPTERERCRERFGGVLALEILFHDAPYEG